MNYNLDNQYKFDQKNINLTWSTKKWLYWGLMPTAILLVIAIGWIYSGVRFSDSALWGAHHEFFLYLNYGAAKVIPNEILQALTLLGDTSVVLLLISPLILVRPQTWLSVVFAIPAGGIISLLGKYLAAVPRPANIIDESSFMFFGQALYGFNSFPSGHCITTFATAAALLAMNPPIYSRWLRWLAIFLILIISTTSCFSRVAIGAHWPLDIMAGAAAGWLAGLSGLALMQKWAHLGVFNLKNTFTRTLIAAIILICISFLVKKWSFAGLEKILAYISIYCGLLTILKIYIFPEDDVEIKDRKNRL